MCIDAMEHVTPEDWQRVLANLRRAVRPGGHLYLTVEEVDRRELDRAFAETNETGIPAIYGEDVGEGTGGYHLDSRPARKAASGRRPGTRRLTRFHDPDRVRRRTRSSSLVELD